MSATLHDNPELSRFEMDDDGVLAVANYRLADNLMTFTHTEVPPQARARPCNPADRRSARIRARTRAEGRGAVLVRTRFPCKAP